MHNKGQGALEYLLLIGGAIVVAVIVVTLLLGVGGTTNTQTANTSAAALCAQNATTNVSYGTGAVNDTNRCGDIAINSSPEARAADQRQVIIGGKTYNCTGTYPSCTAA